MAYTEQTWQDNNPAYPVSAARMAHIESGLGTVTNGLQVALIGSSNGTDDSGAINTLLTANDYIVGALGTTYTITNPINLPAGTTLDLTGCTVNASITVANANTGNKSAIVFGRGAGARLIGGKIDGKSTTGVGIDVSGYNDGQISGFEVRDVEVVNCTVSGLQIQGGYRARFDRLQLHANQVGLLVPSTVYLASLGQFDFCSCWIHDNTAEGVKIIGNGAGIINFFGGNVENNGTYGFNFNPPVAGLASCSIVGMDIEQNGNYTTGIGLWVQANVSSLNVIGCDFQGNSANAKQWKGFQIDSGASRVHLLGNRIQGHSTQSTIAGASCTVDDLAGIGGDGCTADYLTQYATTSGTNYVEITPEGGDANIQVRLTPKGTQSLDLNGPTSVAGSLTATKSVIENLVTLTYSATIATDASTGNEFTVTVVDANAFTISNPTNATSGQRIVYTIRNTSGGALGAVTWGTAFKMAAWTSPATANSRSITFRYDGTNWVEIARTASDIPN